MRRTLRVLRALLLVLVGGLLVAEVVLAGAVVLAARTDHQLVVVTGGSMEPTIAIGSAILVDRLEPDEVQPGVVVTFRSPDGAVLTTHRVVARHRIEGTDYVQTQGDANPDPDPSFAAVGAVVGTPEAVLPPAVGRAVLWLLSPQGRWLALAPALLLLLVGELKVLLRHWHAGRARHARARRRVSPGLAAAAVLVVAASVAAGGTLGRSGAAFASTTSSTSTLGTARLQAATDVVASAGSRAADLRWTASGSPFATGYEVWRGAAGTGTRLAVLDGRGSTSFSDPTADGTVRYTVRALAQRWTADSATVSTTVTRTPVSGPLAACTTTSADGGGFETAPGNACVPDGRSATDADPGTDGCGGARSRHRFGGFATEVPAGAIVTGLEVRHTGSTSLGLFSSATVCVELSGDGGRTWTAPQQRSYGGIFNQSGTFTFGGPSDLWGRAWTRDDVLPGALVVRVTNTSSSSARAFSLDGLQVQVTYR